MKHILTTLLFTLLALTTQAQVLTDTYWRNAKTGEWLIGFAENHVIYDCRTWKVLSSSEKKDKHEFSIAEGKDTLLVTVNKQKKGLRKVRIGKNKPIVCEVITTPYLPDYPTRDERTCFKDNDYLSGDSVTVVGWIKNMPPEMKSQGGKYVDVAIMNFVTETEEEFNAPLDSEGRFKITVPVLNTTQVYVDWGRSNINTVIEPGETYYFLYDVKTGQRLVMGKDARLQNELWAYPEEIGYYNVQRYYREVHHSKVAFGSLADKEVMEYLDFMKQNKQEADSLLDLRMKAHPHLSTRYVNYLRNYYTTNMGAYLMQTRFYAKDYKLPKDFMDFVTTECWARRSVPYTLYCDMNDFTNDYLDYIGEGLSGTDAIDLVLTHVQKGTITLSETERQAFQNYKGEVEQLRKAVEGCTAEEKKVLVEDFNNGELVTQVNKVFIRLQSELREADLIDRAQRVTEKVKCGSVLRDIYTAHTLYDYIDDMRQPLAEMTIDWLNENIKLDFARQQVLALNEKYEALSRKDFSNSTNLLSTDNLEGITEGEQILRKIIEPWKGKIILIDVWGTWCGPCKEALKHSQELYERMKPYDMFFLYMANNSNETSWKNVINEYNVTGENVGHVNLPADQQSAVEDFLKVNSYPSYFLIDREGHLLEVNADPRYLDQFEELVKRVGK
jgi:thiol-disulfide isomerase/thioredoxin